MGDRDHVNSARAVYDAASARYVEFVGTQLSPATEAAIDRSLLAAFAKLVGGSVGGPVADLGCGPGRVAALLADDGIPAIGVDVSDEMLTVARNAHRCVPFVKGELADLPMTSEGLGGAVCWYSIIYTPPDLLPEVFDELARVLRPGAFALFAFQAGDGQGLRRPHALGTDLALTSYRHNPAVVVEQLERAGLGLHANVLRAAQLDHETDPQGFVFACRHPGGR